MFGGVGGLLVVAEDSTHSGAALSETLELRSQLLINIFFLQAERSFTTADTDCATIYLYFHVQKSRVWQRNDALDPRKSPIRLDPLSRKKRSLKDGKLGIRAHDDALVGRNLVAVIDRHRRRSMHAGAGSLRETRRTNCRMPLTSCLPVWPSSSVVIFSMSIRRSTTAVE